MAWVLLSTWGHIGIAIGVNGQGWCETVVGKAYGVTGSGVISPSRVLGLRVRMRQQRWDWERREGGDVSPWEHFGGKEGRTASIPVLRLRQLWPLGVEMQ